MQVFHIHTLLTQSFLLRKGEHILLLATDVASCVYKSRKSAIVHRLLNVATGRMRVFVLKGTPLVQAVLILCDFVLRDFTLMRLENLHHFPNCTIIFGLTRFGIDDPQSRLSNLRNNFRFNVIWHRPPWMCLSSVGG